MFSRFLLGGTFVVFIGVLGVAFYLMPQNSPVIVTNIPSSTVTIDTSGSVHAATTTPTTSNYTTPTPSGYTMAKVATHNTAASCWTAINGKVYNLTNWINQHPGGPQVIEALCGTDGSAAFNGQHGGQTRPTSELKNFLLGPLSS